MTGPFIGIDPAGVQAWKAQLDSAHDQIITALNNYRTIARRNSEVAHGRHFQNLNSQCEEITNKHLADHNDLHAQYTKDTNQLVEDIQRIAG
jgi:dihydroneopterin aldolase